MLLYLIYKNAKKVLEEPKLHELSEHIVDVVKLSTMVCSELTTVVPQLNDMIVNEVVIHHREDNQNVKEGGAMLDGKVKQDKDGGGATCQV